MVEGKLDNYLIEDNIKRICLKDMLMKRECLKKLTIEDLDSLVCDINVLLSNLYNDFKRSEKMISFGDELYWSNNSLFRDIFTHTVLDIKPMGDDPTKRLNEKLKNRWCKK